MKKETTKEITICDFCDKELDLGFSCDTCEKDICWDCQEAELVKYNHAVHFTGSGDGHYCKNCDSIHRQKGDNKRWNAFRVIEALRKEASAFNEDFRKRQNEAEKQLKRFEK